MSKNLFLALLFVSVGAMAQIKTPVKWSFALSKPTAKVGETVDILLTADIDKGWHIFSTDQDPNVGPLPAVIKITPNASFQLVGGVKPPANVVKKQDELFGGEVKTVEGKAVFKQTVKILKADPTFEGSASAQACQDDGVCIPPKKTDFKLSLKTTAALSPKQGDAAMPEKKADLVADNSESIGSVSSQNSVKDFTIEPSTTQVPAEEESLWGFFIGAFLAGLTALLTPCVYPIIPMTVSFFTKQKKNGKTLALFYGFSIIAIYLFFGTVIAYFFGQAAPNFFSTHWLPNLLFFVVFVVFGLSFLGWFEITLPSSVVNKMDAQADRGGWGGVFFMAFTLVLVSFSCTGPIVGTILGLGSQGQIIKPVVGMLGFSLAFAIPFTLFAVFPQWLQSLPKSGGWLNSVKVVLGFLELALALKFLSTIDLVYHWHILDREIYLAIWIALFTLTGLYLIGKLQLPHDSKVESISVVRLLFAVATFSFVVYLLPGMWGAPLKGLSGWLPPLETFDRFGMASAPPQASSFPKAKYSNFLHLPHDLQGFFDYDEAVAYAKQVNKPLFIDFTGHGCVNCRKMEEYVWSKPEVLKRLQNDYVVVALYVDDKTELPKEKWYTSKEGTELRTIGEQNLDFQIEKFNANAQPFYCLIDPNKAPDKANLLAQPIAYNPDEQAFVRFLEEGKKSFGQK